MQIGIVGAGLVGSSTAYAMLMSGIGGDLVLVDINGPRAQAEADDLRHATPFTHPRRIMSGGVKALKGCEVVVISASIINEAIESVGSA